MNKNEFCKKWLEVFASNINENKINKCIFENKYIWHIFSFKLLDKSKYLEGDEAKKAFDEIIKYSPIDNSPLADVLVFFDKEETEPINTNFDTSEKLSEIIEVYVVSKDFKWTYIKTHEDGCDLGPYFINLEK